MAGFQPLTLLQAKFKVEPPAIRRANYSTPWREHAFGVIITARAEMTAPYCGPDIVWRWHTPALFCDRRHDAPLESLIGYHWVKKGMNMKSAPLVLALSLILRLRLSPVRRPPWLRTLPVHRLVLNLSVMSNLVRSFGSVRQFDSFELSQFVYSRKDQGGIVTIGRDQSEVQFGIVERNSVPCDTGRMQLTAEIASQGAGAVFRSVQSHQTSPVTFGG